MNRSASEWALEMFLEGLTPSPLPSPSISPPPKIFNTASVSSAASSSGASQSSTSKREEGNDEVVEVKRADRGREGSLPPSLPPLDPRLMSGNKSDQYHNFLKSQLNLACAAVALTRALSSNPGNLVQGSDCIEKQSKPSQSGSKAHEEGTSLGLSKPQTEPVSTPTGIPALPAFPKNSVVQIGQTTSGSSRDESDEEEIEGDLENMDPSDAKRARRMLSNRESARRSRRRKQAHMTELETQVGQTRAEYSGLLKRLTDMNQKYEDAAVDNRILKANIETLRAKVKMAEETVKRVTGINPLIVAMANGPSTAMPFVSSQLANAGLPIHPNTHFFHHTADPSFLSTTTPNSHQRLDGNSPNSLVGVPQLDTVPDNVSKQIHRHSGTGSGGLH